jgi:hypothetical protein
VRFARRLAAVLVLVGVIVALGLAWGHASGAGPDGFVFYGRQGSGSGLSLSNSGDLIRTVEIELLSREHGAVISGHRPDVMVVGAGPGRRPYRHPVSKLLLLLMSGLRSRHVPQPAICRRFWLL